MSLYPFPTCGHPTPEGINECTICEIAEEEKSKKLVNAAVNLLLAKQARDEVAQDKAVEANRKLLLERSKVGLGKYGVTLDKGNYSQRQLLQHALEEALDLANYLQAEIMRIDAAEAANK